MATDYGRVDYPNDPWPDDSWRTNWTVGVYLDFQLFTGFRTTARIRSSAADQRAAQELLAETRMQADLDERRAFSDVDVARATLAASHHSTELARRAYDIAEVRYRQGVSTYLELVDARIALDQAQINEASAARDVAVSRVRLALLPSLPVTVPISAPLSGLNLEESPSGPAAAATVVAPLVPAATSTQPAAGAQVAPR